MCDETGRAIQGTYNHNGKGSECQLIEYSNKTFLLEDTKEDQSQQDWKKANCTRGNDKMHADRLSFLCQSKTQDYADTTVHPRHAEKNYGLQAIMV